MLSRPHPRAGSTPTDAHVIWRQRARQAVALVGTPCYVLSAQLIEEALEELRGIPTSLPRRHWLSFKTQPVKPLIELWRDWGLGVEVVSEFELAAAHASGVDPANILVNGLAKHHWLPTCAVRRLNVQFDSLAEVQALATTAAALEWRVGLRCQVPNQTDADRPGRLDQFGMNRHEVGAATEVLRRAGVIVQGVHFHIHTNVPDARAFSVALAHTRMVCEQAGLEPEYVNVGGGLPAPGEYALDSGIASVAGFDLGDWGQLLSTVPLQLPSVRELWLENGRFISGRAGALAVTVLDMKERDGRLLLICDGGRINHARMAARELHDIVLDPPRSGALREATICGPTCTSVDRLGDWPVPTAIAAGDRLLWLNAGAYHIPLETRFSFGLAPVVWFDLDGRPRVVRPRETPAEWWAQWW